MKHEIRGWELLNPCAELVAAWEKKSTKLDPFIKKAFANTMRWSKANSKLKFELPPGTIKSLSDLLAIFHEKDPKEWRNPATDPLTENDSIGLSRYL